MAKTQRGLRDGTGSFIDSWQNQNKAVGKRKERGEDCPNDDEFIDNLIQN